VLQLFLKALKLIIPSIYNKALKTSRIKHLCIFFEQGNKFSDKTFGIRILSNLAELKLEDVRLLRVLAFKLEELKKIEESIKLYERILSIRGEEPQSHRDLALALARRGNQDDF